MDVFYEDHLQKLKYFFYNILLELKNLN